MLKWQKFAVQNFGWSKLKAVASNAQAKICKVQAFKDCTNALKVFANASNIV